MSHVKATLPLGPDLFVVKTILSSELIHVLVLPQRVTSSAVANAQNEEKNEPLPKYMLKGNSTHFPKMLNAFNG